MLEVSGRIDAHPIHSEVVARMKIVYGITSGASAKSLLRGQLDWLQSRGYEVLLVANREESSRQAAAKEGVALIEIPMTRRIHPLRDIRSLFCWIQLLRRVRPDIVNVSTPKAALIGGIAAWTLKVPKRVYVVRGLRLEGATGLFAKALWGAEWLTMRCATEVIFVSGSLRKEAIRLGLTRHDEGWTIGAGSSNGVDAESVKRNALSVDAKAVRSSIGVPPNALLAGIFGRVNRDKGLGLIVDLLNEGELDPAWHFLVIGAVEDTEIAEALDQLAGVTRLDQMDSVWPMLGAIDLLVLLTAREGFPNVVLEAAAAGVPSVTTHATGAVDAVVPGVTGVILSHRGVATVREALNSLASHREDLRTLGDAARLRVESHFAPEKIWRGLVEIYEEVPDPANARRYNNNGPEVP